MRVNKALGLGFLVVIFILFPCMGCGQDDLSALEAELEALLRSETPVDQLVVKVGDSAQQVRDKAGDWPAVRPFNGGQRFFFPNLGGVSLEDGKVVEISNLFNDNLLKEHAKKKVRQKEELEKKIAELKERVASEKYVAAQREKGFFFYKEQWMSSGQYHQELAKDRERELEKAREFLPVITASRVELIIKNESMYDWTDVEITINANNITGGYMRKQDVIKSGYILTVGTALFSKPDGEVFNMETHAVNTVTLTCNTPFGPKHYAATSWKPIKPGDE